MDGGRRFNRKIVKIPFSLSFNCENDIEGKGLQKYRLID